MTEEKAEGGYGVSACPQKNGTQENIKVLAPVQDSDALNAALLASSNPREALTRIRYLTESAKHHLRSGNKDKAFDCLNRIGWLTGALS